LEGVIFVLRLSAEGRSGGLPRSGVYIEMELTDIIEAKGREIAEALAVLRLREHSKVQG
jgi:hypothetical protein